MANQTVLAGFEELTGSFNGQTLTSLREVSWKESRDAEVVHAGGGAKTTHIGLKGRPMYEGSIKILRYEWDALVRAAGGSIANLAPMPFTFTTVWPAGPTTVHTFKNAVIKESSGGLKQGDSMEEISLPWIATDMSLK